MLTSKIYTNTFFIFLMLRCLFVISPLNQCDWMKKRWRKK